MYACMPAATAGSAAARMAARSDSTRGWDVGAIPEQPSGACFRSRFPSGDGRRFLDFGVGQLEPEARAAAEGALDVDLLAVGVEDLVDDAQAQARAAALARAVGVDAVE